MACRQWFAVCDDLLVALWPRQGKGRDKKLGCSQMTEATQFMNLPADVVKHILQYVDALHVCKFASVSSKHKESATCDTVWRTLFAQTFDETLPQGSQIIIPYIEYRTAFVRYYAGKVHQKMLKLKVFLWGQNYRPKLTRKII
jgi:hypothetical protein